MAHDWGHIIAQVAGSAATSYFSPQPVVQSFGMPVAASAPFIDMSETVTMPPAAAQYSADCGEIPWGGGTPPKGFKVVNWCGRGVLRKIRRKRRPRILSGSDASDIATIVGLVGKGQMASALINRSRR